MHRNSQLERRRRRAARIGRNDQLWIGEIDQPWIGRIDQLWIGRIDQLWIGRIDLLWIGGIGQLWIRGSLRLSLGEENRYWKIPLCGWDENSCCRPLAISIRLMKWHD